MKARILDFSIGFNRKQRLTIELDGDFRTLYDALHDCDCEVTVKKFRQKRSKNANAYCWQLCGQIGELLNTSPEDVYRGAIRRVGIYQDIELAPQAAKTMQHVWKAHGIGWITEQVDESENGALIRFYYGSSVYNTKQMSRLIDDIVSDAKELGIETKTPEELARLKEEWKSGV